MKKASAIVFIVWVLGFAAACLLCPDKAFSEMENRYLQKLPEFNAEKLFSGRFGTEFESYLNDQFVLRDGFVKLNTALRYGAGLREKSDVYFTRDGALIQKANEPARIESNAKSVARLAESCGVPVYFALLPGTVDIRSDTLPEGAPSQEQGALIERAYSLSSAKCIDVYGELASHADEELYYRTDHHWTSRGAYYGYVACMRAMDIEPAELGTAETLSTSFYGTLYSKAPAFWIRPDKMESYVPADNVRVTAYEGDKEEHRSLYCMENLAKKDKYTVFLGGNMPRVVVETENADAPRLLILRDSYADALTPFLTRHFSRIDLLDCRYYRRSIAEYVRENEIDAVLVCYSVYNFSSDANLSLALSLS